MVTIVLQSEGHAYCWSPGIKSSVVKSPVEVETDAMVTVTVFYKAASHFKNSEIGQSS